MTFINAATQTLTIKIIHKLSMEVLNMTLYELLKEISDILTPNDNAFFDYAIYTSDDNGGF